MRPDPGLFRARLLIPLGVGLLALIQLHQDEAGIRTEARVLGDTPATVYALADAPPAPVVLVAHGFAGSRRLLEPLALALAGRGYIAVTWDLLGHGDHPRPLSGDLRRQDGTPAVLVSQTAEVVRAARELPGSDGRVAVAGHSLATNILVRYAQQDTSVRAVVALSMFSPTVDSVSPSNLLVVPGAWESRLQGEARRAVAMVADTPAAAVEAFRTYGRHADGTARRMAVAPHVEHVGILYSATMLEEAAAWLDASFGRPVGSAPVRARGRGLWIAALLVSAFLLAGPLSRGLPRVDPDGSGSGASWRRLWVAGALPALLTPLVLRPLPTGFLPVVVADYLAVHFLVMGLLTGALLWWTGGRPSLDVVRARAGLSRERWPRLLAGAPLMTGFFLLLVAWPLDRYFTAFFPGPGRVPLLLAVLVGTLPYFLADEWLTRGGGAPRGAYPFTKGLFLLSLVLAVALDFERLFFLVLIVPLVLVFFLVHGLFSRWAYRSTGSPLVAGLANAFAFAWALAVTFPLYAGS